MDNENTSLVIGRQRKIQIGIAAKVFKNNGGRGVPRAA